MAIRLEAAAMLVAVLMATASYHSVLAVECHGNMDELWKNCSLYVLKGEPLMKPSEECCRYVKDTDVSCVCREISHNTEQILEMGNVVYVARYCGNPLQHGMQCGGYTVP